ncbi:MAG: hypothetical protein FOGNACKC_02749 [Anaerolineae bacterium]|nr:hypothetical protein [Anaerolineae bacterium]
MNGPVILAIGSAVLWLVSFIWLYGVANRQNDLQQQLDAFERTTEHQ